MAYQTNTFGDSSMFSGNIRAQLTPGHQLPRTTAEQMSVLEANFKQNRNPNDLEITLVAAEAGMLERDVRVSVYQIYSNHLHIQCMQYPESFVRGGPTLTTFCVS